MKNLKLKPTIDGFGIKDIPMSEYGIRKKSYYVWSAMINRIYNLNERLKKPSYSECSICPEWQYYSNFDKWFNDNYIEGFQLDKDLIHKGNKEYSPDNCVFVSAHINSITTTAARSRGQYPLGVHKHPQSKKYLAHYREYGKKVYLGRFDTIFEASTAYKVAKKDYLQRVAKDEFEKGNIDHRVLKSLMEWY